MPPQYRTRPQAGSAFASCLSRGHRYPSPSVTSMAAHRHADRSSFSVADGARVLLMRGAVAADILVLAQVLAAAQMDRSDLGYSH
jgi:hypothetical protein